MSLTSDPVTSSIGARARASALLALPFQIGSVALAVVLSLIGLQVQPWLAGPLVPHDVAPGNERRAEIALEIPLHARQRHHPTGRRRIAAATGLEPTRN